MSIGNNGDLWIDRDTGDYYAKVDGVWVLQGNIIGPTGSQGSQGVQGPQGVPGTPGAVVITSDLLFGAGPPSDGLGTDGQVYVDTDLEDVYKKVSGHWELQTNLKGSAGFSFLSGNGIPDDFYTGENGDTYVDLLTGFVYTKSADEWTATGSSLKGPAGTNGTDGAAGAAGAQGPRGSFWYGGAGVPGPQIGQISGDKYLNDTNGDVYRLITSTWTFEASIKGATGAAGTNGSNGTNGSAYLSGAGVPSGGTGANGDTYLNVTTGDLYGPKSAGAWGSIVGSLKGTNGTNGSNGTNGTNGLVGGVNWLYDSASFVSTSLLAGDFRVNNSSLASITHVFFANDAHNATGTLAYLAALADNTNAIKLRLILQNAASVDGAYAVLPVTSISQVGGFTDFTIDTAGIVTNISAFSNNNPYVMLTALPGEKGDTGSTGATGAAGATGGVWTSGSAVPTASAADGDYYLRSTNGEVYKRVAGAWVDQSFTLKGADGAAGATGSAGATGATGASTAWTSGSAVPSAAANDGDYYLRTTNGEVYKRIAGSWVDQSFTLKGADGATGSAGSNGTNGTVWTSGSAVPTASATDGDYYLRTTNGEVYKRVSGAWVDQSFSLQGPTGATGSAGSGGGGGVTRVNYKRSTTTTASDPGAGFYRLSNTDLLSNNDVFSVYISLTDNAAGDRTAFFTGLDVSDLKKHSMISIGTGASDISSSLARITAVTINSGWATLTCVLFNAQFSGQPANNAVCDLAFWTSVDAINLALPNFGSSYVMGLPGFDITHQDVVSLPSSSAEMHLFPFYTRTAIRIRRFHWNLSAAAATNPTGRLALYRANMAVGTNPRLGAKMFDLAAITTLFTTTGANAALVGQDIPPGYYFVAMATKSMTGSPAMKSVLGHYNDASNLFLSGSFDQNAAFQIVSKMSISGDFTTTLAAEGTTIGNVVYTNLAATGSGQTPIHILMEMWPIL